MPLSAHAVRRIRSALFVPGDRPERFAKAAAAGADCVILDLEDAVRAANKPAARQHVAEWLRAHGGQGVVVRLNAYGTDEFADDARALAGLAPAWCLLPKVESADGVLTAVRRLAEGRTPHAESGLMLLIESARGVENIGAILASAGTLHVPILVAFGAVDFALDLGVPLTRGGAELTYARGKLPVACRAEGIAPPLDAPYTLGLDDAAGLEAEARASAGLGFQGKLCIHPRQVDVCNVVFGPQADELARAARIVAAWEVEGAEAGAINVDGRMIDAPVVAWARGLLAWNVELKAGLSDSDKEL